MTLEFEQDNKYDCNAIKVMYACSHLGYIDRSSALNIRKTIMDYAVRAGLPVHWNSMKIKAECISCIKEERKYLRITGFTFKEE